MSIFRSIHLADKAASQKFRKHAGITRSQYLVLKALEDVDSTNLVGIINRTGIDRSTMTHIVKRLKKVSLVSVTKDKHDRRSYKVKLTPTGRRVLTKVNPIADKLDNEFVSIIGPRNSKVVVNALSSIAKAA